jgi:hypothetical protein
MVHFTTEDWIDLVNQVISPSKQDEMQRHLNSGCKRCTRTVAVWQRVHQSAAAEAKYQPPQDRVRAVKVAFTTSGPAKKRGKIISAVEVLFDSFLQPALAGARSSAGAARQMLYRVDPYQIDVQIEAKPASNRLGVTGQLLNVSRSAIIGSDIPIKLSNRRGHVVHIVTNEFGEFHGDIASTGDLEISFSDHGGRVFVISLRDPLGRVPGGTRC